MMRRPAFSGTGRNRSEPLRISTWQAVAAVEFTVWQGLNNREGYKPSRSMSLRMSEKIPK